MDAQLSVKLLSPDQARVFVDHLVRNAATPGVRLPPISDPHPLSRKIDVDAKIESSQRRWIMPVQQVGWDRTWGLFSGDLIVGHVNLSTARLLETQLHRVILGMGIEPDYRGRRLGASLLSNALAWAEEQSSIEWVDLGVFAHKTAARRLYLKFGFREVGTFVDCFRVNGQKVDDIQMTLQLRQ